MTYTLWTRATLEAPWYRLLMARPIIECLAKALMLPVGQVVKIEAEIAF